ncbi:cation transporter [Xenophilus arseniciresistens]|uniref:Cation transporter n=1 Tax=Xenophilus arseniciresistens TaxID=1283306 RepID=A0AAE3NE20_9BURK|nr:cation transporter [Xenophilus arseniciresistens]MDA7419141.1 cation transporter [Xenophilus arseniciresistens]
MNPDSQNAHHFQVQGMSCQHCVRAIEDALQTLDAQAAVRVDLSTGRVDVRSGQPREALAAAIAEAGYQVQQG